MITNVKIGLFEYTVSEVDEPKVNADDTRNLNAYIHYGTCRIEVRKELNVDMKAVALLHEIMHGIISQTGLEFEGEVVEEKFVIGLSHGLVALLRHNPELVKYLVGDK